MIIKFAATNFRSIKERIEIDITKTSLKGLNNNSFEIGKTKLLNSAVIFGPNASGKSNILKAIQALDYLVSNSSSFKPGSNIPPYEPFKLDVLTVIEPIILELTFISNKIKYEYNISYTLKRIEFEELYYYPKNTRTLLFKREADKSVKFGDSYKGSKKTIANLLLENQLFLSKAAENNVQSLLNVYNYFSKKLMVFPFMEEYHQRKISNLFAKRLAENDSSKFAKRFNKLICALDTGITGVAVKETDWNEAKFLDSMPESLREKYQADFKYEIKTLHPATNSNGEPDYISFDFDEESTGTKGLFVIGGLVLEALEYGSTLVIDEFEKNLHPIITHYLISLFHNPHTNPNNAQLIFATHDISQLSNDKFRRDQIWFSEKDERGITSLYRCSEIKGIRLDAPLEKWYLTGRFGATPIINDVEFLIEMQNEDEK